MIQGGFFTLASCEVISESNSRESDPCHHWFG